MKYTQIYYRTLPALFILVAIAISAGTALAVDLVRVAAISPLIDASNTTGGGLSLEFDMSSLIQVGNKIFIDLDYRNPSEKVTLSRTIDIEISPTGSNSKWNRVGWDNIPTGGPGATSPFYDPNQSSNVLGVGVYFRIYGEAGSSRITLTVTGNPDDAVCSGPFSDSRLILEFLNGMTNTEYDQDGVWIEGSTPSVYNVPGTALDNTLSLDVSAWPETTVSAHISTEGSAGFSFLPANVEIAHIVP